MSIPVLLNNRDYVESLRTGVQLEPQVHEIPASTDVNDAKVRVLRAELGDLKREVASRDGSPIDFDTPAAEILHRTLNLTRAAAAEQQFWAYLAAVEFPDLVNWRWGGQSDDPPPTNRFLGGWKNTFERLWFRAELAVKEGEKPYEYVGVGGEDFWVGLLEREISECGELVRELLRFWQGKEGSGQGTMEAHRRFFIVLRLLRPYRVYEDLDRTELDTLFQRAFRLSREDWVEQYS